MRKVCLAVLLLVSANFSMAEDIVTATAHVHATDKPEATPMASMAPASR